MLKTTISEIWYSQQYCMCNLVPRNIYLFLSCLLWLESIGRDCNRLFFFKHELKEYPSPTQSRNSPADQQDLGYSWTLTSHYPICRRRTNCFVCLFVRRSSKVFFSSAVARILYSALTNSQEALLIGPYSVYCEELRTMMAILSEKQSRRDLFRVIRPDKHDSSIDLHNYCSTLLLTGFSMLLHDNANP